jgi:hypothetical protein
MVCQIDLAFQFDKTNSIWRFRNSIWQFDLAKRFHFDNPAIQFGITVWQHEFNLTILQPKIVAPVSWHKYLAGFQEVWWPPGIVCCGILHKMVSRHKREGKLGRIRKPACSKWVGHWDYQCSHRRSHCSKQQKSYKCSSNIWIKTHGNGWMGKRNTVSS